MGKTSLAINIINHVLNTINIGISMFSLEMSKMQILAKLVSITSKINVQNIISKDLDKDTINYITNTCKKLLKSNIYLNDSPEMSIEYIEYTLKLLHKETIYVDFVIIDYLQLIQIEEFNYSTRTQELSYITRKLKLLAQNLDIPLIILSQLNRRIENRINKEPILSDLKESGCLNKNQLLNINYINNLCITNIFRNIIINNHIRLFRTNIPLLVEENINIKLKICILLHYIYNIQIKNLLNSFIEITYKHKIYSINKWLTIYSITDYILIAKEYIYKKYPKMIEYIYIKNINFLKKDKVYDIQSIKNLFFIYNKVFFHNSIEQDADIVLILYQQEKNISHDILRKTIDISLCKNRNGPIGSFKLLFSLENTTFTNLNESTLTVSTDTNIN